MRLVLIGAALFLVSSLWGQGPAAGGGHPWEAVKFLEGSWEAKTAGSAGGPSASGTYVFRKELGGHVLARHSSSDACKGPADFDCDHHDLLYIYEEHAGQPLKAIYFDSEGHTIHYDLSTPAPGTAIFLSDAADPGPQFRLVYERRGNVMSGKFQMHMPGQSEWKSYLEWSGAGK